MATTLTDRVRSAVRTAIHNDPAGRISAADAKKIRSAAVAAVSESKRPSQTLAATTKVIAGTFSRPMTSETRAFLERPLVTTANPLAARLEKALMNSFGVGGAKIGASTVQAGQTFVELSIDHPVGPVSARVQLAQGDTIGSVAFLSTPFFSTMPELPTSPFVYDEAQARTAATKAITRHALALASEVGDAAMLEVWLRTAKMKLELVDPNDSPIGIGPNEVQFMASSLWGDNAVFYTVNTQTGASHTDDFN